eukprot:TRINITY_DN14633_c0_g1_i8.p1 TRINITY_DN14633_c0_g1~~TRINITY_DN14633_c0_g1_i8.p1  ORF type:complete len:576 (+),score=161.26 TRINITY_DN14633_c0_g1_i8:421-2148(+)
MNLILKTKMLNQNKTRSQKTKTLREFEYRAKSARLEGPSSKNNAYLLSSLRAMRIAMHNENSKLKKKLKLLQGNAKLTQMSELESENRAYFAEMKRLKELIEAVEKNKAKVPEEDIELVQHQMNEQEAEINAINSKKSQLIKELKTKQKEIEKYKKEIKHMEKSNVDENAIKKYKEEIDKLNKKLKELQKKYKEHKEIERIKNKIEQQQRTIEDLKNLIQQARLDVLTSRSRENNLLPSKDTISKLKRNLRLKKDVKEELKSQLFEHFNDKERVSLCELSKIFTHAPCNLFFDSALNLAEYIIGAKASKVNKLTKEKPLSEILDILANLLNEDSSSSNVDVIIENMNEEELIGLFHSCFLKIKDQLKRHDISLKDLFSHVLFTKVIEGERVEVIRSSDFLATIELRLGLRLSSMERACLTSIMQLNDREDLIKFEGLVQIVKEVNRDELSFDQLDKVSVLLLFALSEHMSDSRIEVEEMLREYTYPQNVEMGGKEMVVDIVDSKDLFSVIRKIGLNIEGDEHDNLKEFLCIAPEYPEKLVVSKLKKAIEEFRSNQELRDMAYRCHQELMDEGNLN